MLRLFVNMPFCKVTEILCEGGTKLGMNIFQWVGSGIRAHQSEGLTMPSNLKAGL